MARFRITVEQRRIGDKEVARKLWEGITKKHGLESRFWLEYVQSER